MAVGIGTNRKKRETTRALALVISACVHGGISWTKSELVELDPGLADVVEIAGELFNELGHEFTGGPASPEQVQPPPGPQAPDDFLEQNDHVMTEEIIANPWAYEMLDGRWRSILANKGHKSVVRHLTLAFPSLNADYWYYLVKDSVEWIQPKNMPRKAAWLTAEDCSCVYGYGGHATPGAPFPEWLPHIMQEVMPLCEVDGETWPNSSNLNLYNDKDNSVSWHADNEDMFAGATECIRIISLSLGAPRTFLLKGNRHYHGPTSQVEVVLFHGDLLIMDGLVQKHFVHAVPKEDAQTWPHEGRRINLTWRWIKKHNCRLQGVHPVPVAQSTLI